MRKNNLRLLAALGLSLNLSLAGAAPAWAAVLPAGPGSEAVEVPENLKDNILKCRRLIGKAPGLGAEFVRHIQVL